MLFGLLIGLAFSVTGLITGQRRQIGGDVMDRKSNFILEKAT